DEAPLALPDGRDEVDDPTGQVVGLARQLQAQLLVGEQRREVLEAGADPGLLGRLAVDLVEAEQRRVLLVAGRRAGGALQVVALAHPEAADLRRRDVDVAPAGQEAARPHEAVALVADLEQPLDLDGLAGRLERAGLPLPLPLVLVAAAVGRGGVEGPVPAPAPAAAALADAFPVALVAGLPAAAAVLRRFGAGGARPLTGLEGEALRLRRGP